ncbi:MAG TPA: hypothetical protein VH107_01625 [Lacipirellulaceae bacterium]|nr:hypothetical protein [Lacipirellulaceae bacterium]
MQEDQIYALQDYINQYQRLLCQYRSENASLKRRLSENYTPIEPQSAEPQPAPLRAAAPLPKSAPQFQPPETPGVKQQQPTTTPLPDATTPDVPPLKTTTDDSANRSSDQAAADERQSDPGSAVRQASYDEPVPPPRVRAEEHEGNALRGARSGAMNELMISGEVVANPAGGPRLMVDVVPFDSNGEIQPFDGTASIMLLETGADGKQCNHGRWDFNSGDVRAATNTATGKPTLRFYVELPSGVNVNGPVQLWVRLIPQNGNKLLTHATVEITKPGAFSSRLQKSELPATDVVAATYDEPSSAATPTEEVATSNVESAWVVAQPGKPANLPPETSDTTGAGGWRASTQAMPAIVSTSIEATPTASNSPPPIEPREAAPAPSAPAKRSGWSADRSSDSARKDIARPSWSATR